MKGVVESLGTNQDFMSPLEFLPGVPQLRASKIYHHINLLGAHRLFPFTSFIHRFHAWADEPGCRDNAGLENAGLEKHWQYLPSSAEQHTKTGCFRPCSPFMVANTPQTNSSSGRSSWRFPSNS